MAFFAGQCGYLLRFTRWSSRSVVWPEWCCSQRFLCVIQSTTKTSVVMMRYAVRKQKLVHFDNWDAFVFLLFFAWLSTMCIIDFTVLIYSFVSSCLISVSWTKKFKINNRCVCARACVCVWQLPHNTAQPTLSHGVCAHLSFSSSIFRLCPSLS